jgi:tRNA(adenine34) deaminase
MPDFFEKTIDLAKESLVNEDVPVGAIIVLNGKIIGCGYNTRERDQNVLGHAEINAIMEATKNINNWNLNGCDMYVSLKPCAMCTEIIKQCRISNVYYMLDKPSNKLEFSKVEFKEIESYQQKKEYAEMLTNFFKYLREKNK